MSDMNSGLKKTMETEADQDYQKNFMPAVHRIGRITMAASFVVTFLPMLYFYFIVGYRESISAYASVLVAITSIGIGMWLTEPLAYWPVLGSAGTYMAYLSGNVGAMRFPVALSVQSALKADINTPRGQIVTILGIGASVFTNLAILFVIVLGGTWILTLLPASVMSAFSYVMPCLFGCMLVMRFSSNKSGFKQGAMTNIPYLAVAVIVKLFVSNIATGLSAYGTAISVGCTIVLGYILYRRRILKAN